MKGDDLAERFLDFGVRVIKLSQTIARTYVGRHVSNQLVRAGTAAGALYEEGRGAESRADFIHKLAMTWKEVRETWYWLRLIQRAELVRPARLNGLIEEASQLSAILSSSLKTARSRRTDQ